MHRPSPTFVHRTLNRRILRFPEAEAARCRALATAVQKDRNFYDLLEAPRTASKQQLKGQFYSLSMKYHPDRNPGNDVASETFVKINEAYSVLSDDAQRKEYDRSLEFADQRRTYVKTGPKGTMRRHTAPMGRSKLHPDDWILYRNTTSKKGTYSYYDYAEHKEKHYGEGSWTGDRSYSKANTSSGGGRASERARVLYNDMLRQDRRQQPGIIFGTVVFGGTLFVLLQMGYVELIFM